MRDRGSPVSEDVTPAQRRRAGELLSRMAATDSAGKAGGADAARDAVRKQIEKDGLRLVSLTITEDPIPGPDLDAIPRADYERVLTISRDMYTCPQKHVDELDRLVEKYPHIPMLRNHLAVATEAEGRRDRAAEIIAETVARFPTYVFAFCSHVINLLSRGNVMEARGLVETGSRGPLFTLSSFDPMRDVFHISEAVAYAAMVGRYLLATGKPDAAKVQLDLLKRIAPKGEQYRSLDAMIRRGDGHHFLLAAALVKAKAQLEESAERRKAREAKKKLKAEADSAENAAVRQVGASGVMKEMKTGGREGERGLFES